MAHLLIVEDEINIQNHLARKAKEINPNLRISITGYAKEALEIAKADPVDVFFFDMHLLDYSGRYLADEIRALKAYEFTPIVFITGDVFGEVEAYRHVQFCQYLIKPFRDEQLEAMCQKVLVNYVESRTVELPQILLEYKGYAQKVYIKDIVYVESRLRNIYMKFAGEKKEYKHKQLALKTFAKELGDDFIQIHQAILVNKKYITGIDKKKHMMLVSNSNKSLPIGSSYRVMEGAWLDEFS